MDTAGTPGSVDSSKLLSALQAGGLRKQLTDWPGLLELKGGSGDERSWSKIQESEALWPQLGSSQVLGGACVSHSVTRVGGWIGSLWDSPCF